MPARAAGLPSAAAGASTYDWSGFYLGGTAGLAWGSLGLKSNTPFTGAYFPDTATLGAVNATGAQTIKQHGIPVGLEAGFNWQAPHSPWVVGFEADIQSLRLSGGVQSGPVSYPGFPRAFFTLSSAASADWLFTARPRLGFALDRWLFYVTGGLAVARPSAEYAFADSGGAIESATLAQTRLGYAAGGGVEVALGNNWSAKAEYLFVDFGASSITSSNLINLTVPAPGQPFTHSVDLKADILRLGLNYRFDPPDAAAGVAAMPVKASSQSWSWSGPYVGGHVGAAAGTTDFADPFGTSVFGEKVTTPAFLGGGQIGFNWQPPRSPWVLGVQADASLARGDGTVTCYEGSQQQIGATCESRPRATGTVTARLGYALGPSGHTLVYGKGGVGWAIDHIDIAGNVGGITELTNSNAQSVAFWGGTAGVGIEQALTPAWSLKVEYDYLGLGVRHIANVGSMTCVPVVGGCVLTTIVPPGISSVAQNFQEMKVGLNYRWGVDPWARWPNAAADGPAPVFAKAPAPAGVSGWAFEGGGRYFGSSGRYSKDFGFLPLSPIPAISSISRLGFADMQTNAGEFFGRIDTPLDLFVKGYVGGGVSGHGHLNDEDFLIGQGGGLFPYSNTLSPIADGRIGYGAIDAGYDVLRGPGYKVGAFAGYFQLHQFMQAFGCSPLAGINCIPPIPVNDSAPLTENATWRALRVGAGGETMLSGRLKLGGEVAYLPYVQLNAIDQHFFANTGILATDSSEKGHGQGVQAEAVLSYYLSPQLSLGVGARYWGLWTTSGTIVRDFDARGLSMPSLTQNFKAMSEQVGAFVQASYKIGD